MPRIVAARFETFEEAESVSHALHRAGFAQDGVSVFFVPQPGEHGGLPIGGDRVNDPAATKAPAGALGGILGAGAVGVLIGLAIMYLFSVSVWVLFITGGIGAYIGSLLGAMLGTKGSRPPRAAGQPTGRRYGGVMAAVRVLEGEDEALAVRTLRDAGGQDIEQAEGQWQDGQWVDFDPVRSPVLTDKVPATAH